MLLQLRWAFSDNNVLHCAIVAMEIYLFAYEYTWCTEEQDAESTFQYRPLIGALDNKHQRGSVRRCIYDEQLKTNTLDQLYVNVDVNGCDGFFRFREANNM